MFKAIPKEIRDQIMQRIKNDGVTADQAANDAGVSPKTVYGWLSKESKAENCNLLELSRLKRENQALCEIVGQLSLEIKRSKKGAVVKKLETNQRLGNCHGFIHQRDTRLERLW